MVASIAIAASIATAAPTTAPTTAPIAAPIAVFPFNCSPTHLAVFYLFTYSLSFYIFFHFILQF